MNHLPTGLAIAALLAGALVLGVVPATSATTGDPTVRFGMDAAAVSAQTAAGVAPDYGTFWVGPWTLSSGWAGPDAQLTAMKNAGVTPAIHFYYWGDDITPTCVENGCWSSLHNAQKTRAGWETLGTQLTSHLNSKMGGAPVVVFLESEFNKGGISSYEPFDGYMAEMTNKIHQGYPNAIVVLGYGNWDNTKWGNFDRAAAASDMVGLQAMRGSTKDSAASYDGLYDATLVGVRKLETLFPGKPIMLTDVALSSYPEPAYVQEQADNLGKFFTGMPALKEAGVTAMIYRSWKDSSNMDLANYYGQAERHWGLAYDASGVQKAAGKVWVDGVKAERAAASVSTPPPASSSTSTSTSATATQAPPADFTATFVPKGNEWWVEVKVTGNQAVTKVEAKAGSGAYVVLPKQDWGAYAKSFNVPKGTPVTFRATAADGQIELSETKPWLGATTTTTTTSSTTTTTSTTFKATFTPKSQTNNWWVESAVTGNQPVTKVEAKVNSGAYVTLPKTDWGTYAKSINAPDGAKVTFRATNASGATSVSTAYTWG